MKSRFCCVVACLTGLLILLAACNPSPPSPSESLPQETNPVHETSPVRVTTPEGTSPVRVTTPEETSPVQETASEVAPSVIPGEEASQAELWMQATLALRSVIMELDTIYTGGKSTPVSAKVDAAGNIYLSMPVSIPEAMAATPDLPQPGDFELFIIDGTAYTLQ